jgi:transposase-like protein
MASEKKLYCPHCKSVKPLWKAGFSLRVAGKPPIQRYQCKNCRRFTVNPRKSKPKVT